MIAHTDVLREVEQFLFREARFCDEHAYDAWESLWTDDGVYWTGYQFAEQVRWPVERSTWTTAAVVLAVDALTRTTPGSRVFLHSWDTEPVVA